MTLARPPTTEGRNGARITRRVSTVTLSLADDVDGPVEAEDPPRKRQRSSKHLSRQVSQDGLFVSDNEEDNAVKKVASKARGRTSPIRCVSEFDKVADSSESSDEQETLRDGIPSFPNPLRSPKLLELHIQALRLEGELYPMRLILPRLMSHTKLNRKGIFNAPVDPVKLGLSDYFKVIDKPMDLGTIKVKLHGIEYQSRRDVAQDIRLVFANAMTYNPPQNAVHVAAKELLAFFEEQVRAFVPELARTSESSLAEVMIAPSTSCEVPDVSVCLPAVSSEETNSDVAAHPSTQPSTVNSLAQQPSTSTSEDAYALRRRKKRGSRVDAGHACDRCEGRICSICQQGCLALEPALLICNGAHCAGARIRKGAFYYIAKDGSRQYCHRCHTGLPPVLPPSGGDSAIRYKRDLLKRKNDEEVVERWIACTKCESAIHQVCAMHDEFAHSEEDYLCPTCQFSVEPESKKTIRMVSMADIDEEEGIFTFVSGSNVPISMCELICPSTCFNEPLLSAELLPETDLSVFIQKKVRDCIKTNSGCPNAERTVHVRVISDCSRFFNVPDVVRKHFRMQSSVDCMEQGSKAAPPVKVNYRSRAIALFQKVDGLDVCIFCMYVHEYDGNDEFEESVDESVAQKKRVYIAYLDSVEHFRPRQCRTTVYREILTSYLAAARKNGYETAHIWACPPSRGNSFVFWNHPASQRTPNQQRLVQWYHGALNHAIRTGVVTDVQSLYESDFEHQLGDMSDDLDHVSENVVGRVICPPLLDGDFWVGEAVRIHSVNMARHLRTKCNDVEPAGCTAHVPDLLNDKCPALQVASMIRDRIMSHPSSVPFRRPVNAAAMKLLDYHKIISRPMDLGTVYTHCVLGEYETLRELVADVELVVSNAQRYNPEGHIVYTSASEMRDLFFAQLNDLVAHWQTDDLTAECNTWDAFAETSLSLDESFDTADNSVRLEVDSISQISTDSVETSRPIKTMVGPDLIRGGPEAVEKRMAGKDTWLLEKTPAQSINSTTSGKKPAAKKRKGSSDSSTDEAASKRRRQSWLGVEVAASVRRMRTFFFTCSLTPKSDMTDEEAEKLDAYNSYVEEFDDSVPDFAKVSNIADARHALLEFSQLRNLEFDTLRHAKYSTAVLLYHLHNDNAPGIIPDCSICHKEIREVRWHKINKIVLRRRRGAVPSATAKQQAFYPEELCSECHAGHPHRDSFVPLQVSMPWAQSA
jgi:hypothetical protein